MKASSLQETRAAPRGTSAVVWALSVLAMKTVATQVAPLLASLYVASLVAKEAAMTFSSYSLVTSVNLTIFLAASGSLQALYFVAGQALGRKDQSAYDAAIVAGLLLALALGVGSMMLSFAIGAILRMLGMNSDVVALAPPQGAVAAIGIIPALWMAVYRVHASLREKPGIVTLVYATGAASAAIIATATTGLWPAVLGSTAVRVLLSVSASNWLMLLLAALSLRAFPDLRPRPGTLTEVKAKLRAASAIVASVGWPIGVVILLDSLAPLISSLIIGRYWTSAIPVHSIVLLWVSLCQVVPVGLGHAAVQRIAVLHSKGDVINRNRVAVVSLMLGAVFGVLVIAVFAAIPVQLGAVFLGKAAFAPEAQTLLRQLMLPGGILLTIQGLIIIGAAILRGVGQTRAPLMQSFLGYCVIAAGSQFLLGPVLGHGVRGVWWGLLIGFGVTAVAVTRRCYSELRPNLATPFSRQLTALHSQERRT
ncbi:MATE family efflux transporter [Hyalangium versicolor]|uniref:MATE family efflux transporter n=1 Tax=Hyalangium versicolor TaxID=2861190 RepID=UPI001CC9AEDC|nr:MATE family efflux transporter [Hyalangium versicolor]